MHALNFPEILGNWKLLCCIRTTVTTQRTLTATLSAHFLTNNGSVSIVRSPAPSSSLQQLDTSDMSLKKVHFGFLLRKIYGYCLVNLCDTTVLPFVMDCKLAKTYIANQGGVALVVVSLFAAATILVYLLSSVTL